MVQERLIPRSDVKLVQSWDSNCRPQSVMIVARTLAGDPPNDESLGHAFSCN